MSKIKTNPPVPSLVGAGDGKRKRKQKKHLENRPTKKVKINLAKRQGKCKSAKLLMVEVGQTSAPIAD